MHVIRPLTAMLPGDEETQRGIKVAEKRMKSLAENRKRGNLSGVSNWVTKLTS